MMGFQQHDPEWSKTLDDPKKVFEAIERNFGQADEQLKHMLGIQMEWPYKASHSPKYGDSSMNSQDRYIDARLAGIESKLDARMEALQRFQEQAESRFQRVSERHETDIALARQQIHQEFKDARSEMAADAKANRKHSTQVAIGTVAGVLAAIALVAAVTIGWITEQGSYAKSYGETQVEIQRAADERAEFRESVKAIQDTQKAILERLPPATTE